MYRNKLQGITGIIDLIVAHCDIVYLFIYLMIIENYKNII
jgi:hypothetical protein